MKTVQMMTPAALIVLLLALLPLASSAAFAQDAAAEATVAVEPVECVGELGIVRYLITNTGSAANTFEAVVTGRLITYTTVRSVTLAPGEAGIIGVSGRSNGIYDVEVAVDGKSVAATSVFSSGAPQGAIVHCGDDDVALVANVCIDNPRSANLIISYRNSAATTQELRARVWYETQIIDDQADDSFGGIERSRTLAAGATGTELISGRTQDVGVLMDARSGDLGFTWIDGFPAGSKSTFVQCQGAPAEAAVLSSCLGFDGRLDVFLQRPDELETASYRVTFAGPNDFEAVRFVGLTDDASGSATTTGRADGTHTINVERNVDGAWVAVAFTPGQVSVSCDQVPTVAASLRTTCLGGNGRIDVLLGNSDSTAANFVVDVSDGDLSRRTRVVPAQQRSSVTITGRPDGPIPVEVLRNGVIVLAANAIVACDGPVPPEPPQPGAAGLGDSYYDHLGNGGYDVKSYDIALSFDPVTRRISAETLITLVVTESLERFNLDFDFAAESLTVTVGTEFAQAEIVVNGSGSELQITPITPLEAGSTHAVRVAYEGVPEPIGAGFGGGWTDTGDIVFVAGEPEGAASWFPVNDHPLDKAGYRFYVTAPTGTEVAANGTLTSQLVNDELTLWTYEAADEMASYLTTLLIGELTFVETGVANGGVSNPAVPIRHVFEDSIVSDGLAAMIQTDEMLEYFAGVFGDYPFEAYGAAVVDERLGFALETQTLSIFGSNALSESIVAHELAHQWFGNHVSLGDWQDIWLNEGFASYSQWLWRDHDEPDFDLNGFMSDLRNNNVSRLQVAPGDPGPDRLFNVSVYWRGALTLHALRLAIGDDNFFAMLAEWVNRYGSANAVTSEFIELAVEYGGPGVSDLLDEWLFADAVPELPEAP